MRKQWRYHQINVYTHVSFFLFLFISMLGQVVLFLTKLKVYSLVSFFSAFATFSVNQIKFEIYIILCQYYYHI